MKKILISLLFVLLFLFVILPSLFLNVHAKTETSGDLQVAWGDPLFPSSIVWYPDLSVTKSITVKNIGSSTHKTEIKADNTYQTGNIADIYLFKISETGISRYGRLDDKTLKNFWNGGQMSLSDVNSGVSTTYDITITMPTSAGNEYQGKMAKFDLIIGFTGTPATITISGGGVADTAVSAPTCSDTAPSSAPTLISAIAGVNSVTLIPSGEILGTIMPGEIKGEKAPSLYPKCLWWPILLGEIIAQILYYYFILKTMRIKKLLLVSVIIPIITYVVFLWLNKDCLTNCLFIQSQSFICRYFWLFDLLIYLITIVVWKRKLAQSNRVS